MKAPKIGAGLAIGAGAALALLLPVGAQAGGVVGVEEAAAPPGITITGIGFARPGAQAHASGGALSLIHI